MTAVATSVETASDAVIVRRVEGLIAHLQALTDAEDPDAPFHAEWLAGAVGVGRQFCRFAF